MKVILKEDIKNVGKCGETKEVSDGYARNYLFKKNLVMEANAANLATVENEKKKYAAKMAKEKAASEELAAKIGALSISISRQVGEEDKMFGAVTADDIAKEIKDKGIEVDKRKIHLPEPIKTLGTHEVEIKLHHEVVAKVKVEVVKQ